VIYLFFDRLAARMRARFPRRHEADVAEASPGGLGV